MTSFVTLFVILWSNKKQVFKDEMFGLTREASRPCVTQYLCWQQQYHRRFSAMISCLICTLQHINTHLVDAYSVCQRHNGKGCAWVFFTRREVGSNVLSDWLILQNPFSRRRRNGHMENLTIGTLEHQDVDAKEEIGCLESKLQNVCLNLYH